MMSFVMPYTHYIKKFKWETLGVKIVYNIYFVLPFDTLFYFKNKDYQTSKLCLSQVIVGSKYVDFAVYHYIN